MGTRTHGLSERALHAAQWGLPWMVVLVVSSCLAHALNTAIAAGPAVAESDGFPVSEGCGAIVGGPMYIDRAESWLVERQTICEQVPRTLVGRAETTEAPAVADLPTVDARA